MPFPFPLPKPRNICPASLFLAVTVSWKRGRILLRHVQIRHSQNLSRTVRGVGIVVVVNMLLWRINLPKRLWPPTSFIVLDMLSCIVSFGLLTQLQGHCWLSLAILHLHVSIDHGIHLHLCSGKQASRGTSTQSDEAC